MSRVGKHPVTVPSGVTVTVEGNTVRAQGKLGTLTTEVGDNIELSQNEGGLALRPRDDSREARMIWGTARTLLANLVKGVAEGFSQRLEIQGVGYRAQVQGGDLVLQLGYSHEVRYAIPAGIKIQCPDQTHIVVHGADKQLVGQVSSEIKAFRPVEPYKGKGIRHEGQFVVRKVGKKK